MLRLRLGDSVIMDEKRRALARELRVSEQFLRILISRNIAEDSVYSFLHPSVNDMLSPFAIDGISAAKSRVEEAIKKRQKILIFGDYDCDGICAVSILLLYLKDKTEVDYFIPDRAKYGYGISKNAVDSFMQSSRPDLVITVDCGITAVEEIEYLKQFGVDVIVTDHHEPQSALPDCIVIDPKIKKEGFYDFCGAGVAFKLVEALGGREEALKYIDIAAIATIADVVPLMGDNRIIAYHGLEEIRRSPRKGVKMLLDGDSVCSREVMFKLAPRLNAAGRLNCAMKVVDLFVSDDHFLLKALSEELQRDNAKRQEICERTVNEAREMLKGADFRKQRMIVLADKSWEAGVLGIAAARLAEDFRCPAILFSELDGVLKGSARSVPRVNVFNLLSQFSDCFIGFGGHAQAAGVTMRREMLDYFRDSVNRELCAKYNPQDFLPDGLCEGELQLNGDWLSLAKELSLLEPTGYGNPVPNFLLRGENLEFENIGLTQHIKCCCDNCDVLGFGRYAYTARARGCVELELNLGINEFRNNVRAQGVIRNMYMEKPELSDDDVKVISLHQLRFEGESAIEQISEAEAEQLAAAPFGTVIVCFTQTDYESIRSKIKAAAKLPLYVSDKGFLSPESCAVIAPSPDFGFGYYSHIILAGKPLSEGYLKHLSETVPDCRAFCDCSAARFEITDETMREIFRELRNKARAGERVSSLKKLYADMKNKVGVSEAEFLAVIDMLSDLGLISFGERGKINCESKKTDLNTSVVYRNIRKL